MKALFLPGCQRGFCAMTFRTILSSACFLILLAAVAPALSQSRACPSEAATCDATLRLAQAQFFGPVEDPNKARELQEGLAPTPHPGVPESGGSGFMKHLKTSKNPEFGRKVDDALGAKRHPGAPESMPETAHSASLEACLMSARRSDLMFFPKARSSRHHINGLAALLGISPAYAIGNAPGEIVAYAVGVLGPACARRRNAADWQVLPKGAPVEVGDAVTTGVNGRVRLQFTDRDDVRDFRTFRHEPRP